MKDGWIKLHRKLLENEELRHHHSALVLLIYLLLDCKDGKWSGGRHQLAELSGLTDSATYRAQQKLKKLKICTLRANSKYTDIYICKWSDFQAQANTKGEQQANSKRTLFKELRIKNKEIKNKENPIKKFTGLSSISDILIEKGLR